MNLKNRIASCKKSVITHFNGNIDRAIILGSGLSGLELDGFSCLARIDYDAIEGLPNATAPSHAGVMEIVSNGVITLALCSGRHHLYEGYNAQEVCTLTYTLVALGISDLIITNAAGALNSDFSPGDVMLISDHINFTGQNPVIGQDDHFGVIFPDMSQAYNQGLSKELINGANDANIDLQHGVYFGVTGPSLETSAERRMFRQLGADAVGMSTVLEVIAANHAGMRVAGISAITNLATGDADQQPDTIENVLANAAIAGEKIKSILEHSLPHQTESCET